MFYLNFLGIDKLLKGGLAKGEIGVILAPTGVGKSIFTTKIANHAFNLGFNVLQIFFEDKEKAIQRKHYTIMSKIPLSDISKTENNGIINSRIEAIKLFDLAKEKTPLEKISMSRKKYKHKDYWNNEISILKEITFIRILSCMMC